MRLSTALALLIAVSAPAAAQGTARTPVVPTGTSVTATLTPGIRVGDFVFSSGQLGMRGTPPDTTIQGQTRIALENVKHVFETAGTTMAQAAKCTVFLVDLKDFAGMNQTYRESFPNSPPARSTVVVAALVSPGAKIEIECMAVMPGK